MKALFGVISLLATTLLAAPASALVVLQYEMISDSTPAEVSTSPELFRQHLDMIAAAGLEVVDLETATKPLRRRKAPPENAVLITFDGSHSSIYETAYPLLKERGWPFVVFADTQALDRSAAGHMLWSQLLEMADNGAAVGNRGINLPYLARQPAGTPDAMWRANAQREIQYAEARIRTKIGKTHKVFAFPHGEYNDDLLKLVDALDFLGVSQTPGVVGRKDGLAMPRFPMTGRGGKPELLAHKLRAQPMPIDSMRLRSEDGGRLRGGSLPADVAQPVLELQLDDTDLHAGLQCSSGGEPVSRREEKKKLLFQASAALPPGHSRYDCAVSDEATGNYYWFSVAFLRPNPDGSWPAGR